MGDRTLEIERLANLLERTAREPEDEPRHPALALLLWPHGAAEAIRSKRPNPIARESHPDHCQAFDMVRKRWDAYSTWEGKPISPELQSEIRAAFEDIASNGLVTFVTNLAKAPVTNKHRALAKDLKAFRSRVLMADERSRAVAFEYPFWEDDKPEAYLTEDEFLRFLDRAVQRLEAEASAEDRRLKAVVPFFFGEEKLNFQGGKNNPLWYLIGRLAAIYTKLTGEAPTAHFSKREDDRQTPFVRFATEMCSQSGRDLPFGTIEKAAERVLRSRKLPPLSASRSK